ncbi:MULTISPECIES: hypothetical protein [Cysteiniphilum]|uniref:Uncharacterized protein n=1 Tax=Cysteiniphilum litorale TaxID=2056700 RepID=A0A8J3E8W7_9GAMM|nr:MULTISPECIES: hypothetical protein [Cysteiniphilum]GGF98970.1 hypothetical protein GCM10010995_15270 [Cysteiniphilum litorale]
MKKYQVSIENAQNHYALNTFTRSFDDAAQAEHYFVELLEYDFFKGLDVNVKLKNTETNTTLKHTNLLTVIAS